MAKKVTSKGVATRASEVLRGKGSRKEAKPGSALSQREKKVSSRVSEGVDLAIDLYRDALKELEKY